MTDEITKQCVNDALGRIRKVPCSEAAHVTFSGPKSARGGRGGEGGAEERPKERWHQHVESRLNANMLLKMPTAQLSSGGMHGTARHGSAAHSAAPHSTA